MQHEINYNMKSIKTDGVLVCCLKELRDFNTFVEITAEFLEFFSGNRAFIESLRVALCRESDRNREIISAGFLDRLYDLRCKSQTVLKASAVLVRAVVESGDCKLVRKIPLMNGMDLNTVDSHVFFV